MSELRDCVTEMRGIDVAEVEYCLTHGRDVRECRALLVEPRPPCGHKYCHPARCAYMPTMPKEGSC